MMKSRLMVGAFAGLAALALAATALPAEAKTNVGAQIKNKVELVKRWMEPPVLHIFNDGQVGIRGAEVTAVSGNTITAKAAWGSQAATFSITTDANTRVNAGKASSSLSEVKVGSVIAVQGKLTAWGSTLSVLAKHIVVKPAASANADADAKANAKANATVGKVVSVDAAANTFVVATANGNTTVKVDADTQFTAKGTVDGVADLKTDTMVRVQGEADASGAVEADKVIVAGKAGLLGNVRSFLKLGN